MTETNSLHKTIKSLQGLDASDESTSEAYSSLLGFYKLLIEEDLRQQKQSQNSEEQGKE